MTYRDAVAVAHVVAEAVRLVDFDPARAGRTWSQSSWWIVDAMVRQSRSPDRREARAGQAAFVTIAALRAGEHENSSWPALLRMAQHDAQTQAGVITLWADVLNNPHVNPRAAQVLMLWAVSVANEPEAQRSLIDILVAVGTTGARTKAVLRRTASFWKRDATVEFSPSFADEILSAIDRE